MTDRELLELAAKAAGIGGFWVDAGLNIGSNAAPRIWNPLTDDGDAFRLMAALHRRFDVSLEVMSHWLDLMLLRKDDPLALVRKHIVSAAAELGKRKAVPHESFDDFSARLDQERRGQQ